MMNFICRHTNIYVSAFVCIFIGMFHVWTIKNNCSLHVFLIPQATIFRHSFHYSEIFTYWPKPFRMKVCCTNGFQHCGIPLTQQYFYCHHPNHPIPSIYTLFIHPNSNDTKPRSSPTSSSSS